MCVYFNDKVGFVELQYSVPRKIKRTGKRARIVLAVICCAVLVTLILMFFFIKGKKTEFLNERSFYLLYVDSSRDIQPLETEASIVKYLGGAGTIYQFADKYYILTSYYEDFHEAEQVLGGIKEKFTNSGIIDIHTKIVSRKLRQEINSEHILREYYEKLIEFMEETHFFSMKFAKNELSEGEFYQKMISWRLKFVTINEEIKELKEKAEVITKTYESSTRLLEKMNEFFNKFYGSRVKISLVYRLSIDVAVEYYESINNL